MGKRGPKPKGKVKIKWSPEFAYAVGLLASDGCLSSNGRHIIFTSTETEQLKNFMYALDITAALGEGKDRTGKMRVTRVQFGDVLFYAFLVSIGLMPNKSKIIGKVAIPAEFFFDFLRGSFDGDGSTYSYYDPRWRSSFMFYTSFTSASRLHIDWLQHEIERRLHIRGHISENPAKRSVIQLRYAKADSLKLLPKMYYSKKVLCLSRKRLKIEKMLRIVGEHL